MLDKNELDTFSDNFWVHTLDLEYNVKIFKNHLWEYLYAPEQIFILASIQASPDINYLQIRPERFYSMRP